MKMKLFKFVEKDELLPREYYHFLTKLLLIVSILFAIVSFINFVRSELLRYQYKKVRKSEEIINYFITKNDKKLIVLYVDKDSEGKIYYNILDSTVNKNNQDNIKLSEIKLDKIKLYNY